MAQDRYCKHCSKPVFLDRATDLWMHLDYNAEIYVICKGMNTRAIPIPIQTNYKYDRKDN